MVWWLLGKVASMATAVKLNLKIEQGASFEKTLTWKNPDGTPVDLTGATARMHARAKVNSPGTPLLDLSTENGGIVLGGTAGTVKIVLTDAQTAAIDWTAAVHDLEVRFPSGFVRRLIQGGISVSPEVTRA